MSMNKSVNVLLPNGRRQNVKITSNTTILQILEEVCQKHGYSVDEYDVKHYNKILDLTVIFRFSGLPNNAQLELVPCTKKRLLSNITIGIQLENGNRVMGEFSPNATLLEILKNLCENENLETAVLIYMQRELVGKSIFERTTLKSLGLNCGKAMLRLKHRDPHEEKTQAHVYTPIPKAVKDDSEINNDKLSKSSRLKHLTTDPITLLRKERNGLKFDSKNNDDPQILQTYEKRFKSETKDIEPRILETKSSTNLIKTQPLFTQEEIDKTTEIKYLGERNALVFDHASTEALPRDELPDNFFELTIEDAKTLLRDAKQIRTKLEDSPLVTESQRQLDQNKQILNRLHKYKKAVIRVQFPDQLILQGLFGSLESVRMIYDFIKNYLEEPNSEFVIYTTPPKKVLDPNSRLIDENLVPSSIVYYSGSSQLKSTVRTNLTDARTASLAASIIRSQAAKNIDYEEMEVNEQDIENSAVPGPSGITKIDAMNT